MIRRGFTLIEVIVACAIGGMAVTAAAALLSGLGERATEIRSAGARLDRDGNSERLVLELFQNLRFTDDSTPIVSGDSTGAQFLTWCQSVEGWLRPCRARLAIVDTIGRSLFTLTLNSGEASRLSLWEGQRVRGQPFGIRYLKDPRRGGIWLRRWTDIRAPAAIQLFAGKDTLIFSVW